MCFGNHKLEIGTRKSKHTGILLDISPTFINCKIYLVKKEFKAKQETTVQIEVTETYKLTSWQRPTPKSLTSVCEKFFKYIGKKRA